MQELKPCPFCGREIKIAVTDEEGNYHPEEYEKNPWSGIGYVLQHDVVDDSECPVANHEGEIVGIWIYSTREKAIAAWNNRVRQEGDKKQIERLKGYAGKNGFYCTCKGECVVDNRTKNSGSLECHCRYLKKQEVQ